MGELNMLTLMRRVASRLTVGEDRHERAVRPRGVVARMMDCDRNNLERLTHALADARY
jgi:hypothetical protein